MRVKWTAVEVYKSSSMKTEITGKECRATGRTLPYWVVALIQQQTGPEQDHLSPLWSPYKSSTFPLFFSAAHKLIKLAFPCCSWQKERERHPERCIVGGRTNAYRHTHVLHTIQFRLGLPQNCYSYQNDTCAADFSWINVAEGNTCIWDVCPSHESSLVVGVSGECLCLSCTFQPVSVMD